MIILEYMLITIFFLLGITMIVAVIGLSLSMIEVFCTDLLGFSLIAKLRKTKD